MQSRECLAMTTKVITYQWTIKTYGQGNVDVKNC
ncbi:hypothetical protein E27107_330001 [Elizabethkingia anophelis]|nr:hypothetical protein E18064_120009 [Elizabethkingia anophelis]CDN78814.1 hypothetical protein E27107_330001 [Elizabethkingia anophelis]